MTEVRLVAAGYVALPAHARDGRGVRGCFRAWRTVLAGLADREGLGLGPVFADVRGREETGLHGLRECLRRGEAVAVAVPDLGHLRHAPCLAGADRQAAQRFLRARVLTAEDVMGG